jgi:Flp pilus assembly protein TadG
MFKKCVFDFVREEHGGGTIMGLLWFMLLVGITGLAVDSTNGLRNRTMLQAAADAAVLAAVIDLPNKTEAIASAVGSSVINLPDEL